MIHKQYYFTSQLLISSAHELTNKNIWLVETLKCVNKTLCLETGV